MLLMKQGEQAWLMTQDGGNHEFARLFWIQTGDDPAPRYRVGLGGSARLGTFFLESCAVDRDGAHLTWSGGRKSHIPRGWFQLTWR